MFQRRRFKPLTVKKRVAAQWLALVVLLNIHGSLLFAEEAAPPAHDPLVCSPNRVALGGYDVVAYHTLNAATMGNSKITHEHEMLVYQFSRAENRALFVESPEKYLPHFRGWCAIALSRNRLTCPDYTNFKVENGKLLLFETIAFFNGRSVWDSDPVENLISAEKNFRRLFEQ